MNRRIIIIHVMFWVAVSLLIATGISFVYDWSLLIGVVTNTLVFGIAVVYLNLYLVVPILLQKNYRRHIINAAFLLATLLALRLLTAPLFLPNFLEQVYSWAGIILLTGQLIVLGIISTMYAVFLQWQQDREREAQLQQEKLKEELKFLKSQINPHFLFNSLNNIYSLAYRQDARAAPMVAKLSQLMRYLLYDCSNDRVKLDKEAKLIQDYIDLYRMKSGEQLNVDFYKEGILQQHEIAPMLLVNFVENCFKHSDIETNPEAWVTISMVVENGVLNFKTENSRVNSSTQQEEGVGLTNSRRQLDLNYPGRHELVIGAEQGIYKLQLKLVLA